MRKITITDNAYLILFFGIALIFSAIFLILGLTAILEYNLAIGLFTSLLTTSLTVIFINFVLSYRKQKQWKEVRDNALFEIAVEMMSIFSEIIELVDGSFNALTFKMTITSTKDPNARKTLILSKIKEYNNSKPLKLAVNRLDPLTSKIFYQARTNLYSLHVIYGSLIDNAQIINDIIKLRNTLRLFELMDESITAFDKMVAQNQPLMAQAQNLFPELKQVNVNTLSNSLADIALPVQTQKLVEIIHDLWNLEIQFDRV